MMKEDLDPPKNPYDKSFRFVAGKYAKDLHENLNLPGVFIRLLENDVVTPEKTNLRMDILELVGPDNKSLKEEIVLNIEHQSTPLDNEKIKAISHYKDYSKCRHHRPVLSVVITPHNPKN